MANPTPRKGAPAAKKASAAAAPARPAAPAAKKPAATGKVAARPGATGKVAAGRPGAGTSKTSGGGGGGGRGKAPQGKGGGNPTYLIGAAATFGGAVVIFILFNVMGGKPETPDRFQEPVKQDTSTQRRETRASVRQPVASGPSQANRDIGRRGGEDDPDLEDRMAAAAERMQSGRQGWDITQIGNTIGDPDVVVETYLDDLREKERIERFDRVGERTEDNDGAESMIVYYVVNPYDLVKGPPHKAPRELLRFVFMPTSDQAREIRERLEQLPSGEAYEAERENLRRILEHMSGGSTYQMVKFDRVDVRDPDYAKFMRR